MKLLQDGHELCTRRPALAVADYEDIGEVEGRFVR